MAESPKPKKKTPQQKAAEARAAQLASEKRRQNLIRIIGAIAVIIVVGGIIGGALYYSKKGSGGGTDPNAALPTDVSSSTYGYQVNTKVAAGAPLVQIWEDFQCPACKQFEQTSAQAVQAEAKKGTINLQLRPTTFLNDHLGNTASDLATNAWGCAIDAGKALEYHTGIFAMQPEKEGAGYTNEQMIALAQRVGITGSALDTFTSCVNGQKFYPWVNNSQAQFVKDGVPGTPTIYVNGKELPNTSGIYNQPAKLIPAIMAAGK